MPDEVHRLRALLIELERLYNLAADLGALANDVGFSLANAHAQRIRERLLRLNATVTGHRLLRGAIRPGRVALRALPDPDALRSIAADLAEVAELTLRQLRCLRPVRRHLGAGAAMMPVRWAVWDTSPGPAVSAPTPASSIP